MRTRKSNDMSHDVSRAPIYYATLGRMTTIGRKYVQNEASGQIVAECDRRQAFMGNSVGGSLLNEIKNARNILKTNARPALPSHAPAGGAGPFHPARGVVPQFVFRMN